MRPRMYGSTLMNTLRTSSLPLAGLGQLDLGQLEVLGHGLAVRAPRESYLPALHGREH